MLASASFVAHDLRTPLSAISLAGRVLEQLLSPGEVRPEVERMLKALRRNVIHLEKLVNKVLDENANLKTEVGITLERRETELWVLVEGLVHDLDPVAETASTRLINSVPDELVAYVDASLLKRIFQNLIANARTRRRARSGAAASGNAPADHDRGDHRSR